MQRFMILAAVAALTAGPALAQPSPPEPPRSDRTDDRYDRDDDRDDDRDNQRVRNDRRDNRSAVSDRNRNRDRNRGRSYEDWDDVGPPSHWGNRGRNTWARHVNACLNRYRSYNPRTDLYYASPGVARRCRLALPGDANRGRY